ncbi:MAG: hypothetical protein Q9214_006231 [Letrouitia sp. 1 TL-2023]
MVDLWSFLTLSVLGHSVIAASGNCDIKPLSLRRSNVSVSDDIAVSNGVELGVGTPNQIFALIPSTSLNNTRLRNKAECGDPADPGCVAYSGGVWDNTKSSTFSSSLQARWNGSLPDIGANAYFNDVLDCSTTASIPGLPIVNGPGGLDGTSQAGLPLGSNSSLLSAMVKANLAPSKAFGYWVGDQTTYTPADGKLVIGGYDSSRVEPGSNHSFPIASVTDQMPCPLQVNVTQITFGIGVDEQSLFGQDGGSFTTCIEPSTNVFVFPPKAALILRTITNSNSTPSTTTFWSQRNSTATSQLRITLDGGYSTTFYPEDYIQPHREVDKSGHLYVYDDSVGNLNIVDNADDDAANVLPQLGLHWLKKNYLIVDYEKNEFQVARALQGPATAAENLVPLCTPTTDPQNTTDSLFSTHQGTIGSGSSSSATKSINTSAIAGGVVGGAAGLALIGCLLFWLQKHRRRLRSNGSSYSQQPKRMLSPEITLRTELPASSRFELAQPPPPLPEKDGTGPRHELVHDNKMR